MKSIKEQADYLYQGYGTNPNRKALRENFIQGADYVLEEIEAVIQADLGNYKSQLDRIKLIIEQLIKE